MKTGKYKEILDTVTLTAHFSGTSWWNFPLAVVNSVRKQRYTLTKIRDYGKSVWKVFYSVEVVGCVVSIVITTYMLFFAYISFTQLFSHLLVHNSNFFFLLFIFIRVLYHCSPVFPCVSSWKLLLPYSALCVNTLRATRGQGQIPCMHKHTLAIKLVLILILTVRITKTRRWQ